MTVSIVTQTGVRPERSEDFARWQGETGTLSPRSFRPAKTLLEAVSVVVFPISSSTSKALTMPTVLEVFLNNGPSSSVGAIPDSAASHPPPPPSSQSDRGVAGSR